MNRDEILTRIATRLSDVLDLEAVELAENSSADDFDEWHSVNHVRLLIGLEQDFGFQFNTNEIGQMETVGDLVSLIESKLAQN